MHARGSRVAARVVAALAAVFWGFFWFGLIDLLVVVDQDERFHEHYLLESGWGLLYLVLVTVPLVVLAVRPGDPTALAQVGVCAAAVVLGGVWASAAGTSGPGTAPTPPSCCSRWSRCRPRWSTASRSPAT